MNSEINTPLLVADGISKTYTVSGIENQVIGDVSLKLYPGEVISVVGPSGCGKTTLLNMLCGLLPLSRGSVTWRGNQLAGMPDRVGYMLQKDLLLPWRSALANVQLGLELKGHSEKDILNRSLEMLNRVGLGAFEKYYPSKLSGGMRQRVALARTLVTNPEVLLLDEPFAALDFQTKLLLEGDMARLVFSEGCSLLMITHDVEEAVSLSDRVVVLSHRPSCVLDVHRVNLGVDRTDMMAARHSPHFSDLVRLIWSQLEVQRSDDENS